VTAPEDLAQSAIYRHPSDTLFGRMLPRLLHAPRWTRLRRALSRRWPMPALVSDVRDVVYVSWWVDVRHAPMPPPGHHYVVHAGRTPYTILSYRHGHFGPGMAGRCALMPSPRQSNWRWYLRRDDDPDGTPVVLFDRNVMDQLAFVAGRARSAMPCSRTCPRASNTWCAPMAVGTPDRRRAGQCAGAASAVAPPKAGTLPAGGPSMAIRPCCDS
jgi:hypothetical protein